MEEARQPARAKTSQTSQNKAGHISDKSASSQPRNQPNPRTQQGDAYPRSSSPRTQHNLPAEHGQRQPTLQPFSQPSTQNIRFPESIQFKTSVPNQGKSQSHLKAAVNQAYDPRYSRPTNLSASKLQSESGRRESQSEGMRDTLRGERVRKREGSSESGIQ